MTVAALVALVMASMLYTLTGAAVFVATSRLDRPCHKDVVSTNARLLIGGIGALALTGLLAAALPLSPMLVMLMQLTAYTSMGTVVWVQVGIARQHGIQ